MAAPTSTMVNSPRTANTSPSGCVRATSLVKTSEMLNAAIPQTIAAMPRRFAPNDSTNATR
jgi:hypothetical protein